MTLAEAVEAVGRAVRGLPGPGPRRIALDGPCGSGKSTLAAALRAAYGWPVIPMDHFFLRPVQRTPERLLEPGGNVDRERFIQEVLRPLLEGGTFSYRPYDCRRQALGAPVEVCPGPVTVVEGSYSCHPALWDSWDLHVFLQVGPEEQRKRLENRCGPEGAAVFRKRWIPLEEAYFRAYSVRERSELRLTLAGDTGCERPREEASG